MCEFSRILWFGCPLQLDFTSFGVSDFRDCWKRLFERFKDEEQSGELCKEKALFYGDFGNVEMILSLMGLCMTHKGL